MKIRGSIPCGPIDAEEAIRVMSLAKRFLLMAAIVIALTDLIAFYAHGKMPLAFVISVIAVTILPIVVILGYWIPKYKLKW